MLQSRFRMVQKPKELTELKVITDISNQIQGSFYGKF
jgi:hypothetical protein